MPVQQKQDGMTDFQTGTTTGQTYYTVRNSDTYKGTYILLKITNKTLTCNGDLNAINGNSVIRISEVDYKWTGTADTLTARTYLDVFLVPTGNSLTDRSSAGSTYTATSKIEQEGGYKIASQSIGYESGTGKTLTSSSAQITSFGNVTIKSGVYEIWGGIYVYGSAISETTSTNSSFKPTCDIQELRGTVYFSNLTINTIPIEKGTQIFTNGLGYKRDSDNLVVAMTPDSGNTSMAVSIASKSGTSATTIDVNSDGVSLNLTKSDFKCQVNGGSAFSMLPILAALKIPSGSTASTFTSAATYSQSNCNLCYKWWSGTSGRTACEIVLFDASGAQINLQNKPVLLTAHNTDSSGTNTIASISYKNSTNANHIDVYPFLKTYQETTHSAKIFPFTIMVLGI